MDSMAVNKTIREQIYSLSLKPYMREGRKHSIDSAVRLFGAYKRNKNAEEII